MTVRTRAGLKTQADTVIDDNHTGDVSPADARELIKDLADSATFPEDLSSFSAFTGASAGADGASGLVPKPLAGQQKKSLLGGGGFGSPVEEGTVQPTADVAASTSLAVTGLSLFKRVDARWFFELIISAANGTRQIAITARVSGGTKRTLVTLTTPTGGAGSKMVFYGDVSIAGMNEAQEKVVKVSWGFSANSTTLDSSNAINNADTTTGDTRILATWDEVWDELSIDLGVNVSIAGATTDERGRLYTYGYP